MKTLKEVRQEHIRRVLDENEGDIEKTSRVLQIPENRLRAEARGLAKPPDTLNAKGRRPRGAEGEKK